MEQDPIVSVSIQLRFMLSPLIEEETRTPCRIEVCFEVICETFGENLPKQTTSVPHTGSISLWYFSIEEER
jgi:hypothetical protein